MAKASLAPIAGFPEWLPQQRMVELAFTDTIRRRFELHGYVPLETRSVEPLDQLLAKGETDKEIYVLRRLQAEADEEHSGLGLHFDLTIPFARYVQQFRNDLAFPFRRYQIQRAWRGERPQEGRYREFYQADADVIAQNELNVFYDVEMTMLLGDVLEHLPIPFVAIQVNNRKILEGYYRALGIEDLVGTLRAVDKLDKLGAKGTLTELVTKVGMSEDVARKCLEIADLSGSDLALLQRVEALGAKHPMLEEGLHELELVLRESAILEAGRVVGNLRIARGLDYYTGVVFEGVMKGHESGGSVCSGGRYDNLASGSGIKLPGIGVSVGVSRILGRLFARGQLDASRKTPTCVLVALASDEARPVARAAARALRERGIAAEVFDRGVRWGKQMDYAEKKGIPFVWFPADGTRPHDEVRDIRTGEQVPASLAEWSPPADDLAPRIVRKE